MFVTRQQYDWLIQTAPKFMRDIWTDLGPVWYVSGVQLTFPDPTIRDRSIQIIELELGWMVEDYDRLLTGDPGDYDLDDEAVRSFLGDGPTVDLPDLTDTDYSLFMD